MRVRAANAAMNPARRWCNCQDIGVEIVAASIVADDLKPLAETLRFC
jgi:hypothetical protein